MQATSHDQDREEMSWIRIFFYCGLFFVVVLILAASEAKVKELELRIECISESSISKENSILRRSNNVMDKEIAKLLSEAEMWKLENDVSLGKVQQARQEFVKELEGLKTQFEEDNIVLLGPGKTKKDQKKINDLGILLDKEKVLKAISALQERMK